MSFTRICVKQNAPPCVFPPLLAWCPHLDSWYLFSFPLFLFCPSIPESQANSPLVCLSARVATQAPSSPCLSAVPSPVCQAFSAATVLQTLTRPAPQLRLARSLLSELQSIPDFYSFAAPSWGSMVGRCIQTIVLCSSDLMDFNTKKLNATKFLPHQRKRKETVLFLACPPHPAIVSTRHY